MNFTNRLIYFIFGFSIGLIFLFFFFDRKNTSFNYLPSSRVKNNLLSKNKFWRISKDSALIKNIIINGEINFSKSKIGSDSCNIYYLIANQNKKIFTNSEL